MTRLARGWWVAGGALVVGQLLLPEGLARDVAYLLLGAGAVVLTWWGMRTRDAQPRPAWAMLLAGLVVWVVGDAGWALTGHIVAGESFPPVSDGFYLAGYALFAVALFTLARSRRRRVDWNAIIDGLIVGTVVALLVYVSFVAPPGDVVGAVTIDGYATLAYLVFDILILVQVAYLLQVERLRRHGLRLVGFAFLAVFVGDVLQTMALRFPSVASESTLIHSWWLLAYLLLGAAPLHRSRTGPAAVAESDGVRPISARQIAVLGVALAIVPSVPGIQLALGVPVSSAAAILASALVISLVCLRLGLAAARMREQAAQLERAAATDGLTGLATSRHFQTVLDERARQAQERPVLVLIVALDRLTEITDTLGYRTGDELLREAAARVQEAVGERGTAARLAGDAFAVVMDAGEVRHVDAVEWAAKLRLLLTATFTLSDVSLSVDAIVGVAVGPDDGADGAELLQRADVALSAARNRPEGVARYTGRMTSDGVLTPHLMSDLSRALEQGEIVVHYQPQVDVDTGEVRGVEALVRWQHPVHGLLPPAVFIPAAERTGLIGPLTRYLLDRVVAQAVVWWDAGTPLRVAANLSVRDLLDPTFAHHVADLLDRHGLDHDQLELELTETMALVDPERSMEVLRALADLGVVLSIDDFGTGYSSLAHLQRLPVNRLKIDRSFVTGMVDDDACAAIVRSTIELARNLGMTVVAEGVEDDSTLMSLRAMGCDLAQGFGLGRPVPADQVAGLIAVIAQRVPRLLRGGIVQGQRIV